MSTGIEETKVETIHARSYERGYQDALNATNECTLRDQFAMAALTGLVAAGIIVDAEGSFMKATAVSASGIADAMLTARQGSQETDNAD